MIRLPAALLVVALSACSAPPIRHSVTRALAAPPATTEFFIAVPEISSPETDADTQRRNREWAVATMQTLRQALDRQGGSVAEGSRQAILPRIYIVYEATRVKTPKGTRRTPGFVEVQLQWKDLDADAVRYETFAKADLDPTPLSGTTGWGVTSSEIVDHTLHEAVERFVAGLFPPAP
jgi:hypothetical protein